MYSDQDLAGLAAVAPDALFDFAEVLPELFDFALAFVELPFFDRAADDFAAPPFLDLAVDDLAVDDFAVDDFAVAPLAALDADARDADDFVVLRAARVADAAFDVDVADLADVFAEPLAPFVPEERVEPEVLREDEDFAPVLDAFDAPVAAAEVLADERLRAVPVAVRLELALALPLGEVAADLRDRVPEAALDVRRAASV